MFFSTDLIINLSKSPSYSTSVSILYVISSLNFANLLLILHILLKKLKDEQFKTQSYVKITSYGLSSGHIISHKNSSSKEGWEPSGHFS